MNDTKNPQKKYRRKNHPLSKLHFRKVIVRLKDSDAMKPIIGITWNLKGKTVLPFGEAAMMVQSTHPSTDARSGVVIELGCFNAQVDPTNGSIHYSNSRMSHDFARSPYPGAHGRVLDPRDPDPAQRGKGNGSWVRLGLEVDWARSRAARKNWKLPVLPQLPKFWAGFTSMGAIDMEITPAMKELIATHSGETMEWVNALDTDRLNSMANVHWPDLWVAPGVRGNTTKYYWIESRYVTRLQDAHMFEDFRDMVGVDTRNPAKDLKRAHITNPTVEVAKKLEIDLKWIVGLLTVDYADNPEGKPDDYDDQIARGVPVYESLKAGVKEALGYYKDTFSDAELDCAVANPSLPFELVINDPANQLEECDLVPLMRAQLEKHLPVFSAGTTAADLIAAAANMNGPLHASNACKIQTVYRDTRIAPETSMVYSLGDRVYANLYQPTRLTPYKSNRKKVQHVDLRTEPVPVETS